MSLKNFLIKTQWILADQFGFNPLRLAKSMKGVPAFVRDYLQFKKNYSGPLHFMPALYDRYEEGGATKNEYFWQDLLVARAIHKANPEKHVDVGSRVDGFVAHVASFREIEVFDVRPITTEIPGVVFRQADLMNATSLPNDYCDSLSCLHTIEHFGLGRYGDPVNPNGYKEGIKNIVMLLKPGGTIYLSTPIGKERVEFNANRVFDPRTILNVAEANGCTLKKLTVIRNGTDVHEIEPTSDNLQKFAGQYYNLGIFEFIK